jgi:hypothetical protein
LAPDDLFHPGRRAIGMERQFGQSHGELAFVLQHPRAIDARCGMAENNGPQIGRQFAPPGGLDELFSNLKAVHTNTLFFFITWSFASSMARPRCSRERMVPTGQPITAAASS